MKIKFFGFAFLLSSSSFTFSQTIYPAVGRRGHFFLNGSYQNRAPQTQSNLQSSYQQASNNVIGNVADNSYETSAVNSIVGQMFYGSEVNSIANPSPGSANNVIGNKAYNTHTFYNLAGLSSLNNNPYAAQLGRSTLQDVFENLKQ